MPLDRCAFDQCMEAVHALQFSVDAAQLNTEAGLAKARQEMNAIIQNTNISLMARWNFFVEAPEVLKNHFDSLYTPKDRSLQSAIQQDIDAGRRRAIFYTDNLLEGALHELMEDPNTPFWWDETTRVRNALEEVLCNNIGSFVLDW